MWNAIFSVVRTDFKWRARPEVNEVEGGLSNETIQSLQA